MIKFANMIAAGTAALAFGAQAQSPSNPVDGKQELQRVEITGHAEAPLVERCEPGVISTLPMEDRSMFFKLHSARVCLDNVDFDKVFPAGPTREIYSRQLVAAFGSLVGSTQNNTMIQTGPLPNVENMLVAPNASGGYAFVWTVRRPGEEVTADNSLPGDYASGKNIISTLSGVFGAPRLKYEAAPQ